METKRKRPERSGVCLLLGFMMPADVFSLPLSLPSPPLLSLPLSSTLALSLSLSTALPLERRWLRAARTAHARARFILRALCPASAQPCTRCTPSALHAQRPEYSTPRVLYPAALQVHKCTVCTVPHMHSTPPGPPGPTSSPMPPDRPSRRRDGPARAGSRLRLPACRRHCSPASTLPGPS